MESTWARGEIQFFVYVNHSIDCYTITMQSSDHCLKVSLLVKPMIPMVSQLTMDSGYESETFSIYPDLGLNGHGKTSGIRSRTFYILNSLLFIITLWNN